MSTASALVSGIEPSLRLVEDAVRQALEKASLRQAGGVILFLTPDFSRHAHAAVLAAARSAGCLQIMGTVAQGLLTETGWVLDQPAAAALVLGDGLSLAPRGSDPAAPLLSLCANTVQPTDWRQGTSRYGLIQSGAPLWQAGRLVENGRIEAVLQGARCHLAVSTGLRRLGKGHGIEQVDGHDLVKVDGLTALQSLDRVLPPEIRDRPALPLHLLGIVREGLSQPAIPILAANADGSFTLAERLQPGERIHWTLRQPLAAESDMAEVLTMAAQACPRPDFALMFSCIGRGPLFYGDDDRDLVLFRERFPGVPLLGAYGSGQIAPAGELNRQWQNTAVTAFFKA